jgi:hypothetical protein
MGGFGCWRCFPGLKGLNCWPKALKENLLRFFDNTFGPLLFLFQIFLNFAQLFTQPPKGVSFAISEPSWDIINEALND